MLWLVSSVKLVCEVALMAWLGRWVLGLLIGPQARQDNAFDRLLGWVVAPLQRLLGPRAPLWMAVVWVLATGFKIRLCLAAGAGVCR